MTIRRWCFGFTLIELMVCIAIMALLVSLAYPSYQQYVIRANRAAAQQFLMDAASVQHQYLLANNGEGYASETVLYGATGNGCNSSGGLISVPSRVCDFYTVRNILSGSSATFIVQAIPSSGKMQNGDGTLEVHHDGEKVGTWE
ncbi:type IV pilin protein [Porticoccaceae bacterium nBUS_09]